MMRSWLAVTDRWCMSMCHTMCRVPGLIDLAHLAFLALELFAWAYVVELIMVGMDL